VMSAQVESCLQKAAYCDRMASMVSDPDAKARFADAAKRWRETARRIERLEDELTKLPKSD
jgi:hypothetical protein